jgi:hypothetical protein
MVARGTNVRRLLSIAAMCIIDYQCGTADVISESKKSKDRRCASVTH